MGVHAGGLVAWAVGRMGVHAGGLVAWAVGRMGGRIVGCPEASEPSDGLRFGCASGGV
ncbi:MAG: hypothetical protein ACI81P_003324, partial [Neolewinella sp.]